jgi:CRP/FNR family transcriptional regulator, cyclic AMP receptor protein
MAADEKLEHLRRVPLFARLGRRQLERLGQLTDEIEVGLDSVLTEQGRLGQEFFVVVDGHVSVHEDGRLVAQLHPGDFFGEIALLDGHVRTATVRAEGLTRLLVIGHREFLSLMDEFPDVRAVVESELAQRRGRDVAEGADGVSAS